MAEKKLAIILDFQRPDPFSPGAQHYEYLVPATTLEEVFQGLRAYEVATRLVQLMLRGQGADEFRTFVGNHYGIHIEPRTVE